MLVRQLTHTTLTHSYATRCGMRHVACSYFDMYCDYSYIMIVPWRLCLLLVLA